MIWPVRSLIMEQAVIYLSRCSALSLKEHAQRDRPDIVVVADDRIARQVGLGRRRDLGGQVAEIVVVGNLLRVDRGVPPGPWSVFIDANNGYNDKTINNVIVTTGEVADIGSITLTQ